MQYIRVSDVVNELSLARRDDSRQEYLRYLVLSKSVLRDLKFKFLNDFKRVYLPINTETMTVRIPVDYSRLRTLSVIENCKDQNGRDAEKVIPLTLNPYINITPQEPITCDNTCNCEINHPVCQELSNYELIEEDIDVELNASPPITGKRQTILRVCPNGDIVKEVSEPVQRWIEGDQICDYEIEIARSVQTLCSYEFIFSDIDPGFPIEITMTLNGVDIHSGVLANVPAVNAFFSANGWTVDGSEEYSIASTTDIWGLDVILVENSGDPDEQVHNLTLTRECAETTNIAFPFEIVSYVVNGVTIIPSSSPASNIDNQAELDAFFASIGFTKIDDTHYEITETEDVYFSMLIETSDSVPEEITINFIQSNCIRPLVNNGYENQLFTDVLCNVELKACGCIVESASNIETIVSCCSPFLNCCQNGQLTNWKGWSYIPSCCPTNSEQPYNKFGEYNVDEKNYIIYLNSVNASRVLLSYDSDGICDGEYYLPDYTIEAFKAGLAWRHAQYNEEVHPVRRRELEINFKKESNNLQRDYTDTIKMPDLINALRTRKWPY